MINHYFRNKKRSENRNDGMEVARFDRTQWWCGSNCKWCAFIFL